jgi:riboflavin kinase/FMN adenylyltransferase
VLSFDPHPDVVLAKRFRALAPLTPIPEKRARLASLGIARLEVLPFTRELAALSPEEFVERHLVSPFAPGVLVVGENFALGRGRSGDVPCLRRLGAARGFEVEAVPLLRIDGAPVTSTRVRELLGGGRVEEAARLLGRRYGLEGRVVHGEAIGRTLGFPTANLRLHEEKLVPRFGIYAAWARIEGEREWRRGAMSIGVRPTFGGQAPTIEVFILDWDGELHGRDLEVELECWLREERRFESVPALVEAMHADVAEARRRLGAAR